MSFPGSWIHWDGDRPDHQCLDLFLKEPDYSIFSTRSLARESSVEALCKFIDCFGQTVWTNMLRWSWCIVVDSINLFDNNGFVMSETTCVGWALIIFLLSVFEQSTILAVLFSILNNYDLCNGIDNFRFSPFGAPNSETLHTRYVVSYRTMQLNGLFLLCCNFKNVQQCCVCVIFKLDLNVYQDTSGMLQFTIFHTTMYLIYVTQRH